MSLPSECEIFLPVTAADETTRAGLTGLAVVVTCSCQLTGLRRAFRDQLRPGQRRFHAAKASDRDRKLFMSIMASTGIGVVFETCRDQPVAARAQLWSIVVPKLVKLGVVELVIERGEQQRDLAAIERALFDISAIDRLRYRHATPHEEPMLWAADAAAWALGKGGHWADRLRPLMLG